MGTVLCKLFSYFYTISLSHSSGVGSKYSVSFRFVSSPFTRKFIGHLLATIAKMVEIITRNRTFPSMFFTSTLFTNVYM